jgi:predicted small lipoprotein YifL
MNFTNHSFSSSRRARQALLAGVALVLALSAACGKKGPLYLPDDAASVPGKTDGQVTTPAPAQPPK